jgi:hypothetical protein
MIWTMLSRDEGFDQARMTDRKLGAKAESMREAGERRTEDLAVRASAEEEGGDKKDPGTREDEGPKSKQKSALPRKKTRKKLVS